MVPSRVDMLVLLLPCSDLRRLSILCIVIRLFRRYFEVSQI
jgi:hypothetical protein